jgi:hypothetical protein
VLRDELSCALVLHVIAHACSCGMCALVSECVRECRYA